ncbi:MAG: NAD-glutamate dehydrogenase [Halofilum sp. (in: g-proteobacteria)]|nr:NAD-glutamate dehydrogenase [Halofilum sp. (in: g-proteobacteria)]
MESAQNPPEGAAAIASSSRPTSINALVKALRRKPQGRDPEILERLARQVFGRGMPEEFARQPSASLVALIHWVHDFCLERRPADESKIRIAEPSQDREGWEMPYALVAVITNDNPFLVDSVSMAVSEQELSTQAVFHPVLYARRDKRGRLTQLVDRDEADAEGIAHESLMLFWLERPVTEDDAAGLTERIETALFDVAAAVADWREMRAKVGELTEHLRKHEKKIPKKERQEACEFLEWLANDHFTFLGYREYDAKKVGGERGLVLKPESGLGILREQRKRGRVRGVDALEQRLRDFSKSPIPLIFTKTDARSTVHRRGHMDYIGVLRHDDNGRVIGEDRFVGLYTSNTYHRSAWEIPFIRHKADAVMKRSKLPKDSHAGKALVHILETLPREELFQSTNDELYSLAMGVLELEERPRTRLFIRRDHVAQFFSCLVFIPRERFNTEVRQRVQRILTNALGGARADFQLQLGESDVVRVHYIVRPEGECTENYDSDRIERDIVAAVRSWHDDLRDVLIEKHGDREGLRLAKRFEKALPPAYVDEVAPRVACYDVERIDALTGPDDIGMSLYHPRRDSRDVVRFKIFKHDHTIPLSEALPMLERMGLRAVTERPYEVRLADGERVWIQDFDLVPSYTEALDAEQVREPFQEAFEHIWRGHAESDNFNRLILAAHMDWQQASLLRAYCKYLLQTGVPFSQAYMEDVMTRHPLIARLLVELFEGRLDPARHEESKSARDKAARALRGTLEALVGSDPAQPVEEAIEELVKARSRKPEGQVAACLEVLDQMLDAVSSLDEERILRAFVVTIEATLRTNVYQVGEDGEHHDYMAFKLDSRRLPDLPRPRPLVEIFVYSPRFEAVHLRGGRVARGGLRWSDRREDFRTEILGLMKAQSVKNTMIVPVGAKGGFVPKQLPEGGSREAIQKEGIACYRRFISGLLDVTDNLVKGEIRHPQQVLRHDDPDPYMVVAADKGTATFSDIANEVSVNHEFWLGDAFASGGSNGYDHKGMGITARGAWESVKRLFREKGIDCQKEEFTAVGIGDMGGDVFGNGMLLSKKTRLVAAFNHLHIFIDPNPDAEASYKERQRLFKAKASGWDQYNTDLISRGGGVWSRQEKRIKLSQAARDALGIEQEELNPFELMRAIVCAPVDLFWNGGIGTYVKGSDERDEEVGDRANRLIRVNGNDLRCRIVGEGGNLGLTQAGRVEYCLNGGAMHTDFIDNSAGVDCSDHEVNIKILLNAAVDSGELKPDARNKLLEQMTDEVAQLVLRNNYLQTQAISMMSAFTVPRLGTMAHFIAWLESRGVLDRQLEHLPDEEEIEERKAREVGLTRPELAVLLSYSKIMLFPQLLDSDVPEDPYLARELVQYFPEPLRETYHEQMRNHRLWREIIATQVTNYVINRMGATFVMRMQEDTSATPSEIARAFTIAREVFDANELWAKIEGLDNKVDASVQTDMLLRLWELLRHATRWLLNRPGHQLDIAEQVEAYRPGVQALVEHLEKSKVETWRGDMTRIANELEERGVPKQLAAHVAVTDALYPALDIVDIANELKRKVEKVGWIYARLGDHFGLKWLRSQIERLPVDGVWHANARGSLRDQLYEQHRALTVRVIRAKPKHDADAAVDAWLEENELDASRVHSMMTEMQRVARLDYATGVVALRALEQLVTETA